MKISDFDYSLPEELIAQYPAPKRSASRLIVLNRKDLTISHRRFPDIIEYIYGGDSLVLNDTKVMPVRLFGVHRPLREGSALLRSASHLTVDRKEKDVEVLLLKRLEMNIYSCLIKPSKKVKVGDVIKFDGGNLEGQIIKNDDEGRIISFDCAEDIERAINEIGSMPLPPYIKRKAVPSDIDRYQTVYAKRRGAIAAPTAGLHFTKEILKKVRDKGASLAYITLHVGHGTFSPVRSEDITEHKMESEYFEISRKAADLINFTRKRGGKVICCGTTTVRALESVSANGRVDHRRGETRKFIHPPYKFSAVDALLTNFHLPRTTLLMLVCAFAGREFILRAYEEAIAHKYRFYSYGDAMLIL